MIRPTIDDHAGDLKRDVALQLLVEIDRHVFHGAPHGCGEAGRQIASAATSRDRVKRYRSPARLLSPPGRGPR
jgi:hypothetical protein